MLNKEDCNGKHIQMEEPLIIEYGLDQSYSLKGVSSGKCEYRTLRRFNPLFIRVCGF